MSDPYGTHATRRETTEGTRLVISRTSNRLLMTEGRVVLQADKLGAGGRWLEVATCMSRPEAARKLRDLRELLRVQIHEEINVQLGVGARAPWYYVAEHWVGSLRLERGWYVAGRRLGRSMPEIVHGWCTDGAP
jgi:hypothetical protein